MKVYGFLRDYINSDIPEMKEHYLEQILPYKDQLDIEEVITILEEEKASALEIEILEEALGLSLQ